MNKRLKFVFAEIVAYFIYQLTCVSAVNIEIVSLMDGKEYLQLQTDNNAVLECNYNLEEAETVKSVTWYHDEILIFTWGPQEPPKVEEGVDENKVSLSRGDGNLEYLTVSENDAGKYRCDVTTSAGVTAKSPSYQLLVIDMPDGPDTSKFKVEHCKIQFSWESVAVKPRPAVMCGIWSAAHGYTLIATKWLVTPYYNGSVSYHLSDELFEIFQMPLDSLIKCEIKITKIDDSKVNLTEKTYNFTEVWERGCHPLEVGEGVNLEYDNERLTCHSEIAAKDDSAPAIANVMCDDGHEPKYGDYVSSVSLICKGTRWDIGDDLTWSHFDNLLCVKKPKLPPTSPTISQNEEVKENIVEMESTSSVNGLITPWVLISLLGLSLISGAIWGLRNYPKKKDPRYMA